VPAAGPSPPPFPQSVSKPLSLHQPCSLSILTFYSCILNDFTSRASTFMPSIIPWRTSPPSCAGTPLAPKLHRVPLPDKDPEDDIILFMATKDPTTPAMHIRQIKTSNPSKPPPVLKSCLKKRDPSPSSSSTTSSSASSSSYPRSPPPQFRSREDVSIYSESETSPTRLKGYRGRHLRATDGAETDYEKSTSRHPRSNLKNSSEFRHVMSLSLSPPNPSLSPFIGV